MNGTSQASVSVDALCRDCATRQPAETSRCKACGSPRLLAHPELDSLEIAHIDCDAFYATVEKRDDPSLRDRPVIIGGGRRGVVSAACYHARLYGIHSAMPMFKALKACPDAVVIKPDMQKYAAAGRQVREIMLSVTPLVEPISIDEAFLDLSGTRRLHRHTPAELLVALVNRLKDEVGITASIGLSYNKFLAKVASDADKPRGFFVIGRGDAQAFLAAQPVTLIWGVGKALAGALHRDGIAAIADLLPHSEAALVDRYGQMGHRLFHFARGHDTRRVNPHGPAKSISAETTFNDDLTTFDDLSKRLWPLCEKVSRRLKAKSLATTGVTLKLKRADFRILTRSRQLTGCTQLADQLYKAARPLLEASSDGTPYRLIGIGTSGLADARFADQPDLADPDSMRRAKVERAIDDVRAKLGDKAIARGRGLG